jgi:hypothetical protein
MTAALNCLARSRRLALRAASVAIVVFALAGAAGAQCTGYGTQIGAQFQQVTGALTNYTAVISVTDSRLATVANGGLSQSTGFDICIGDSANTVAFPLQIRKYVATTGAYMAAVQVPSLSASAVTVVNLWVGKAGVSDPSTTAAWDANFMQVYPLQETCTPDSATAGCFKDATSRAAHSTGGKYPTQVAGLLGNAQSFVSASNENIVVPNEVTTGNAITLSGWFKTSTTTASTLIYDQRAGVSHNLGCYVYTNVSGFIGALCGNGSNDVTLTGSANLANGLWHHYAFANIGATLTGYVDGASIGSAINGAGAIVFGTGSSCIGPYCSGGTIPWNGSLQDLRLSNTSRSAAWIKADYDAFHAPGTFFQLTAPVSGPTITSVGWSNLSAYSAVFTWSTGAAKADSQVECGINGGSSGGPYTTYTTPISDPVQIGSSDLWGVTAHRLGVNLPASYGGHCIVLSTNQAGGTTASADQTVTTPAAPVNIPIGVASVSPRVNLTNGATGYSGDIDMMAATADGQWILAGNDGAGKAISSSQYCCTDTLSNGARLHMSKWPTLTTRYMLLRQDDSTPTSPIHNVFGPQPLTRLATEPYWEITGGSCAAGVAIVNFEDRGYTIPVGTPIWVAGASPAGYNVSSVAIAASTATSVQYTGTCAALAWVSGGTVAIWNDGMGTHQSNFGIDSVNGLVCFTAVRTVPPYNSFRICSTDYFAHSFNHAHNAPGGPATVANVDMPLPSTPCFLPGCAGYRPLLQIVPCRDYGGANQTAFPCTWLAGTENYIYYVGTSPQVPSGYYLFREAYADHKLVDGARWQAYIGAQVCDDRMLYNANWSSTLTAGTLLNSQVAAYGQSFSIVTAPDFNGFIGAQWTGLPGNIPAGNVSQSAGATLYDMGPWLTCTATPLGSVNRDETDINYFPTWSFLVPASYNTVSSGVPVRATVQLRQSGSVVSSTGNPSNNK